MESDYRFLLRAGELGLSRIELCNRDSPFLARDEWQTYIWMGYSGEPKPRSDKLQQVVSPTSDTENHSTTSPSIRKPSMMSDDKNKGTSSRSNSKNNSDTTDTDSIDQLIEQATALKGKLKDLQSEMQDLITSLRTQKKQSRIVRSTIDSLQKLNSLQV